MVMTVIMGMIDNGDGNYDECKDQDGIAKVRIKRRY